MKKYLTILLLSLVFGCGDDDELDINNRTAVYSADASQEEYNFLGENASQMKIDISCPKCTEGQENQSYIILESG